MEGDCSFSNYFFRDEFYRVWFLEMRILCLHVIETQDFIVSLECKASWWSCETLI